MAPNCLQLIDLKEIEIYLENESYQNKKLLKEARGVFKLGKEREMRIGDRIDVLGLLEEEEEEED